MAWLTRAPAHASLRAGTCASARRLQLANASLCWASAASLGVGAHSLVNVTVDNPASPAGCFLQTLPNQTVAVTFNKASQGAACNASAVREGEATSKVNVTLRVHLDPTPHGGLATITLAGPASTWFAAGFDATHMADAPYTIVANASSVWEQQIGTCGSEAEHCEGSRLQVQSLTLVSNTVVDGAPLPKPCHATPRGAAVPSLPR